MGEQQWGISCPSVCSCGSPIPWPSSLGTACCGCRGKRAMQPVGDRSHHCIRLSTWFPTSAGDGLMMYKRTQGSER